MDDREREADGRPTNNDGDMARVCRNFLRGACTRGLGCSFRHLAPEEIVAEMSTGNDLCRMIFCRDFQKSQCRRPNCRLLHATADEEVVYRKTGKIPLRIMQLEALGGTLTGSQGYVQSMYATALAAQTIPTVDNAATTSVNPATIGNTITAATIGNTMIAATVAPAVDSAKRAEERVQELELEVKGLHSLNRSLLEENNALKKKVDDLEEKLNSSQENAS